MWFLLYAIRGSIRGRLNLNAVAFCSTSLGSACMAPSSTRTAAAEARVRTVRLFVDSPGKRVLFAEASEGAAAFLFALLAAVGGLLRKDPASAAAGCFGNLAAAEARSRDRRVPLPRHGRARRRVPALRRPHHRAGHVRQGRPGPTSYAITDDLVVKPIAGGLSGAALLSALGV